MYVRRELSTILLDGPVEIDETLIYKVKRGQADGRLAKIRIWLFGIKSRQSGRFVLYPLLYRDKEALYKIILTHVPYGSLIYSDCWSAYVNNKTSPKTSHLANLGYLHLFVDHSVRFVSSISNTIHVNTIERLWQSVKKYIRIYRPKIFINEYLAKIHLNLSMSKDDQMKLMLRELSRYNV